jgi:hypothetical protein
LADAAIVHANAGRGASDRQAGQRLGCRASALLKVLELAGSSRQGLEDLEGSPRSDTERVERNLRLDDALGD